MRMVLLLSLLLGLAACQGGPSTPSRDNGFRDHYGGVCSPYASNCW